MSRHKVIKKKHDGGIYTEHGFELLEETADGIYGLNPIGDTWFKPAENVTFSQEHITLMYFSKQAWYNFLYYFDSKRDGAECLYLNLATPYQLEGDELSYTDYDLDLIWRNGQLIIDDVDEWQARKEQYPPAIVKEVEATMVSIILEITSGQFEPLLEIQRRYQAYIASNCGEN